VQTACAEARTSVHRARTPRRQTRLRLLWNRADKKQTVSASHDCIFCRENRERGEGLIEVLEGLVDDEDFAQALVANGLCMPHTQAALQLWKQGSKRKWLEGVISQRAADLTRDLNEFIRKHEHRYQHEPFGSEADVVRRAMEFIVGLDSYMDPGKSG
jgi:hypothetical protein